jgi:hypothetical protein
MDRRENNAGLHAVDLVETKSQEERPSLADNILWVIRWGITCAALFSIYVGVLFAIGHAELAETYGMTVGAIMVGYFAAGLVAGTVVGILRPLTRWIFDASLVGFVAGVGVAAALVIGEQSIADWSRAEIIKVLVLGTLWGPAGGIGLRAIFRNKE